MASTHALNVLVVGGSSRAAQAFRRYARDIGGLHLTTLVRSPIASEPNETVEMVEDHFSPHSRHFDGIDAVINFAAITRGRDRKALFDVNVDGPKRLAKAAKRHHVRHFIQMSSTHVYGSAEQISRTTAENPTTPYGRSKYAADIALQALASSDFAVTILRVPPLYGAGTGHNLCKLGLLMARLGWFPVPSTLGQRSVLNVRTLAAVLTSLLFNPQTGIQFAADREALKLKDLAEAASSELNRPIKLVTVPSAALLPLAIVSRRFHERLYGSNLIAQTDCIPVELSDMAPLKDGLKDLFVRNRTRQ